MDQSLIAWMMSGGTRPETVEERHQRMHRTALHDVAAGRATDPAGGVWRGLVSRWSGHDAVPTTSLTPACCPA